MAQLHGPSKILAAKVVYCGPGGAGKTTNLRRLYEGLPPTRRGEVTWSAIAGDRTASFECVPPGVEPVAGWTTRLQLCAVQGTPSPTGQSLMLTGADALVFVADSRWECMWDNAQALETLRHTLQRQKRDLAEVPLLFQWNKRDLPTSSSPAELDRVLNPGGRPWVEASASTGAGVLETLREVAFLVLERYGGVARRPEAVIVPADSGEGNVLSGGIGEPVPIYMLDSSEEDTEPHPEVQRVALELTGGDKPWREQVLAQAASEVRHDEEQDDDGTLVLREDDDDPGESTAVLVEDEIEATLFESSGTDLAMPAAPPVVPRAPSRAVPHEVRGRSQVLGGCQLLASLDETVGTLYGARDPRHRNLVLVHAVGGLARLDSSMRDVLVAAGKLRSVHLVALKAFGAERGKLFLVYEWLKGNPLGDRQLEPSRAAIAVWGAALGVRAVHRVGRVHGAIHPGSLVVDADEGTGHLLDLGLAQVLELAAAQGAGALPRLPRAFRAPECARGAAGADPRVDVYALGATLYSALTGRAPAGGRPAPPSTIAPDLPPWLESICLRCLCEDPRDRYPSAEELAADLDGYLQGPPTAV